MHKAEMVREQWLELKIFFLRCLYCRVICSFVLLLWLQLCMVKWLCSSENGTGRSFFSKACNFGWESFWRGGHVYLKPPRMWWALKPNVSFSGWVLSLQRSRATSVLLKESCSICYVFQGTHSFCCMSAMLRMSVGASRKAGLRSDLSWGMWERQQALKR